MQADTPWHHPHWELLQAHHHYILFFLRSDWTGITWVGGWSKFSAVGRGGSSPRSGLPGQVVNYDNDIFYVGQRISSSCLPEGKHWRHLGKARSLRCGRGLLVSRQREHQEAIVACFSDPPRVELATSSTTLLLLAAVLRYIKINVCSKSLTRLCTEI